MTRPHGMPGKAYRDNFHPGRDPTYSRSPLDHHRAVPGRRVHRCCYCCRARWFHRLDLHHAADLRAGLTLTLIDAAGRQKMTFRVGQKVVCIRGTNWGVAPLKKGEVYVIAGGGMFGDAYFYDLVEVATPVPHAWCPSRFRAIVERKTDITIFTEILRKATKPARSPAMSLHQL
jgi:hypothetical protein